MSLSKFYTHNDISELDLDSYEKQLLHSIIIKISHDLEISKNYGLELKKSVDKLSSELGKSKRQCKKMEHSK